MTVQAFGVVGCPCVVLGGMPNVFSNGLTVFFLFLFIRRVYLLCYWGLPLWPRRFCTGKCIGYGCVVNWCTHFMVGSRA